jgi:hypothetical protein
LPICSAPFFCWPLRQRCQQPEQLGFRPIHRRGPPDIAQVRFCQFQLSAGEQTVGAFFVAVLLARQQLREPKEVSCGAAYGALASVP